ncbi:hypothetical protein D8794_02370 [Streptococcus cristatus]|uniref:Uncharacterized protein n=3 Tax=Streptococcus cristatus TaxID=45634 RepID=A0A428GV95_STRCR|nr:hypothetical protein D8794_02370 [Streptococcus cristatus]
MKYYEKLSSKEGSTDSQVIIIYSTKDKEILK